MSIFLGSNGNDTITPDTVSPDVLVFGNPKKPSGAADLIIAGGGNDTVAGGGGNDFAFLGAGDDAFLWRSGDGNDFVDGGAGSDRLGLDGSAANESIAVSAGVSGLASVTRDVGDVKLTLDNIERLEIATFDGQDRITVNDLSQTDVKQVAIDLAGSAAPGSGDGQADVVTIGGSASADHIRVDTNGDTVVVSGLAATTTIDHADAGLDRLVIDAGGGNDRIDASGLFNAPIGLTVDGGAGDDTIVGGAGADLLLGGEGDDIVTGGRGSDSALLGAGNDTFIWNPGDGSDIVEGQAGIDTMDFRGANIAEHIDISANGERVRFFRDVASVTMDLNDVEHIDFKALGGADDIVVADLSGTDVRQVNVDLAAALGGTVGDGQADKVTVDGTAGADAINVVLVADAVAVNGLTAEVRVTHGEAGSDQMIVAGLDGNDTIDASTIAAAPITLTLDGGAGNDMLKGSAGADRLLGGADNDTLIGNGGADTLFGGTGDDVLTGGDGDDQMFGEDGNDRFVWNPGDDSDLVEGGAGIDTLEVNGGNGAETFTLTPNGARVRLDRIDPAPFNIDAGTVEKVVVNLNGGDDVFTGSNGLASLVQLTVDGGAGNDTITGGDGADFLLGGDGDDSITGGRGNDTALLGAGNDTFVWNPGDGSDIVEGQAGIDTMDFRGANIAEHIDISANGERVRFFRDVASVTMDLNDVEHVNFKALGGTDDIAIHDLSGTDVTEVNIDLGSIGGTPDAQADNVSVAGTNGADHIDVLGSGAAAIVEGLSSLVTIGNVEAIDRLTINGFGGDDVIDASRLSSPIALTIDGGSGNDTLTGTSGADILLGGDGNDTVSGGRGDDLALLGAGDDIFSWLPGEGSDVVEGQAGVDTLDFVGAAANESIDISANGERVRFFRDVANITMDLNDVERIHFAALGGTDRINVGDLSGTDATSVDLDLGVAAAGDAQQDIVSVQGSAGDDSILVSRSAGGILVDGLAADVRIEHFDAQLDTLIVSGGAGNDVIDARGITADSMLLQLQGGDGADLLVGGEGADLIVGGRGDDVALMGAGDDTFVWNPGDGSDTLEGQAGFDTMLFNGSNISENIDISANGERVRFFRDVASVTMDSNAVEKIDFRALGGADDIKVHDLSGTDVEQVNLDLGSITGTPDGAADRVTVDGTGGDDAIAVTGSAGSATVSGLAAQIGMQHADSGVDTLVIQTGAGNDVVDASGLPATSLKLNLDGGDGDDVLLGGAGDDVMRGGAGDDVLIGGEGNDVLDGGAGDDVLIGGGGIDIFLNGEITIQDFQAGAGNGTGDKIDLKGVAGAADFASVMAHAQDVGGNVVLDFGAGTQMTLEHLSSASLHADNFIL